MNETERYEAVRHCRYVDEVLPGAPWQLDMDFIEKYKIDFVAHDEEPYGTANSNDIYAFLKERGMFVPTQRTEGVSTSDVVARIVKDYDLYVRRNLARGYTAKDLNVSFMKEKRIKFRQQMESLKETGKRVLDNIDEKTTDIIHKWEDKSRDFMHSFLLLFGREGRLSHMWNESRGIFLNALSPPGSPSRRRLANGEPCTSSTLDWPDDDDEEESESEGEDELNPEIPKKKRRVENYFDVRDDSDEDAVSN
jgi:choline-phosphate cytidylyltransferase